MSRVKDAVLRLAGRPVRCDTCGEVLFRGAPFVWRGRLRVVGAGRALVAVRWHAEDELTFNHVEARHCRREVP